MAAPFVRATRAIAQAGRKVRAGVERPELLRKVRARERRAQREREPLTEEAKRGQIANAQRLLQSARELNAVTNGDTSRLERIRAVAASTLIAWTVLPFYSIQLMFWFVGFVGLGSEVVPVVNWVLPGQEIFMLSYFVIVLVGLCSMVYAAWIYTIRGVKCFSGSRALVFMACLTGYLVFFLNLFPWIVFWIVAILYSKK